MRKKKSAILEAVHDTAEGLHKAGAMDPVTMREFDQICLLRPCTRNLTSVKP
jgi:putative transcriptional regulator